MLSAIQQTMFRPSSMIASTSRAVLPVQASSSGGFGQQVRFRSQYAPRRTKYRKSQKGSPTIPIGGSIKGTSLESGTFGLRVLESTRLTASQLTAAVVSMKRKIKPVKGAEVYMRVFPDVPVCVKGNETRMGKGKGTFEYWACRVPSGRVILEIGGGGIREEIAKQAMRLAQVKLPVATEFITTHSTPRLGDITSSSLPEAASASPVLLELERLEGSGSGKVEGGAAGVVAKREARRLESLERGLKGLVLDGSSVGVEASL